jgi:hypothetical protein
MRWKFMPWMPAIVVGKDEGGKESRMRTHGRNLPPLRAGRALMRRWGETMLSLPLPLLRCAMPVIGSRKE